MSLQGTVLEKKEKKLGYVIWAEQVEQVNTDVAVQEAVLRVCFYYSSFLPTSVMSLW